MNYGEINLKKINTDAERICDCIGHGINGTAKEQIIETAIAETGLGRIEDKTPNSAGMGITQFDKMPFEDVKKRTMKLRPKILQDLNVDIALVKWEDLKFDHFKSLLFTRLHYWLKGSPIPKTIEERAKYWKLHYNTFQGKGTVEHYLEMNRKYGA